MYFFNGDGLKSNSLGLELKKNGVGVEIILNSEINIVFSGVGIKNNNFS